MFNAEKSIKDACVRKCKYFIAYLAVTIINPPGTLNMTYSALDIQALNSFKEVFDDVLESSVSRYKKAIKDQGDPSEISLEIKEIANSSNKPLADILTEALPFCEKVDELNRINDEKDEDPSAMNPRQSFAILDLTLDILEDYWDILSTPEQTKIKRQLEPGTLANADSTSLWADIKFAFKILKVYFGPSVKNETIKRNKKEVSDELTRNKNTANKYLYLFSRGLHIAENIILKEKVYLPFRSFIDSYVSVRLDKFVESLESREHIKPIVNHYFGSMAPSEVVSRHKLESKDHLYAVLAYYYRNKQEVDQEAEERDDLNIEIALKNIKDFHASWDKEFTEEELIAVDSFMKEKFGM